MFICPDPGAPGLPETPFMPRHREGAFAVDPTYRVYTHIIHGRNFTVAFGTPEIPEEEHIMETLLTMWDHHWHLFGGFAFPSYTVIFRPTEEVHWPGAHGLGIELPYPWTTVSDPRHLGTELTDRFYLHELSHGWLSISDGAINTGDEGLRWFVEGAARYIELHTWQELSRQEPTEISDEDPIYSQGYQLCQALETHLKPLGHSFLEFLRTLYHDYDYGRIPIGIAQLSATLMALGVTHPAEFWAAQREITH